MRKLLFSIIVLIALALVSVAIFARYVENTPCRKLEAISNDRLLNEKLRSKLTEFINDIDNRNKLLGTPHQGYLILSEYTFDESLNGPYPWSRIFDSFPAFQRQMKLILKIDSDEAGRLDPPYRISEVGVYGARSLLMYTNENPDQYTGGEGAVRLSEKPYVKCQVNFYDGFPIE